MTKLASNCPLGTRWCGWSLYSVLNGRHLLGEERGAILRARRRAGAWTATRRQPANWSVGDGDPSRLPGSADMLSHRRHRHCWLDVARRAVHIDWVSGEGGSPRFSYSMVRVYVDGILRDEQVHGGSALGFTVWGTTALAPVCRGLGLGVEPAKYSDPEPPSVWLLKVTARATPATDVATEQREEG